MSAVVAEFIGTMILVLLGNGVVANVVLAKTKGHGAGWIVITFGWGIAVFVGASIANEASGAHLNPAVTVGQFCLGSIEFGTAMGFMFAQMLGAMAGAALVFQFYEKHFEATESADDKLACFCTAPAIPGNAKAFLCELVGTFVLVFTIMQFQSPAIEGSEGLSKFGLGSVGLVPIALLVLGIGLCLGGTTGYAINPARDLGPRIVHHFLKIPGKRDSDWNYAWIPVLGPIAGAVFAALIHNIVH